MKIKEAPHGRQKNRTRQEAQRLGISEDKLIALVKAGVIPCIQFNERLWIYDPGEVDDALKELRAKKREHVTA